MFPGTRSLSIFGELKRRNVFRVAAAYVVTGWLVVQVAETLFPIYNLPHSAVRLVVNVLAIGLIPAVLLAWAFEWTPEGLKRDEDVDHQRAPGTGQVAADDLLIEIEIEGE